MHVLVGTMSKEGRDSEASIIFSVTGDLGRGKRVYFTELPLPQ